MSILYDRHKRTRCCDISTTLRRCVYVCIYVYPRIRIPHNAKPRAITLALFRYILSHTLLQQLYPETQRFISLPSFERLISAKTLRVRVNEVILSGMCGDEA